MSTSAAVERVREALRSAGVNAEILILDKSTRTAALAADALSVPLGSIVKSLVFMADGMPVLVLVSGDRRADERKIATTIGAACVRLATADEVKALTGFPVGGVPPVGHKQPMPVLIDAGLSRFRILHAAAGHPQAVFPIESQKLQQVTNGLVCEVTEVLSS